MSKHPGNDLLAMIQERYPDYHPIMAVVGIAHDKEASLGLQMDAAKTILRYTLPELRAIDISGTIQQQSQVLDMLIYGDIEDEDMSEHGLVLEHDAS